ncbi:MULTISPECIES: HhoA/HhoB/HtrA family serine endopeptidase [unclassified Microcoleus]|uniref:HhoA/HhoB/HtrA family serine endopeptidase n=1 Tax=unclassified Microcoleus TaxID=2642155 RepID=UPI001D349801|nr:MULTISPECIES: HhoA/HhoB/HtrA family serine endopeptidase [unclassified Microcoleus]TAG05538.1 MAG: PDZ domain-containing protein [Oscillatoriales cyanobacterium]MCC3434740.1 trypsin-like peptidase domain-containing protein [Microcoleus sp. PH2017_05_CCC_O_A]MCC3471573.1 trypsin-like peptidase domain-containing protein [Microcoleus sp. PH2017_13_LAR_U_A]MCC3483449.1 trypsin-like peptidase domain-containing protein [Microcoleus sp. PH2017_14_LAR_D_A]MCC3597536.1 trypsin-like peptidase domain-
MKSSTGKFWKQPAIYILLLVTGAGAAMLGDRLSVSQLRANSGDGGQRTLQPRLEVPPANTKPQASKVLPPVPLSGDAANVNFIVAAVAKVGPAVVRIDASRKVKPGNRGVSPEDFFGGQPNSGGRGGIERGTGSGFAIGTDGVILTNAHVVEGADTVNVTLKDGRSYQGRVLGADKVTDVAVVKIEANDVPVVTIGNSDKLLSGEWAIAIGNPLGLDNSVTAGIISATGRSSTEVGVPDKRIGFIQTDAAINPGNSGGPLLNASGEVIGMNTAIIQGAQGLGFAIPIQAAQEVAQELISTGKVEHAYLGIEMATLTPEVKQQINGNANSNLRVAVDRGVAIVSVVPNSPAAAAGLRAGDVIQKINNQPIIQSEAVQDFVQNAKVGGNLQMEINRNGQIVNLSVKPGSLPVQQVR